MNQIDFIFRALMAGALIGGLYLALTLIGRFIGWLRRDPIQDVGRAAGSVAGAAASKTKKLSESFKDGFGKHSS